MKNSVRIGPGAIGIYQWLWDSPYHFMFFTVVGLAFLLSALMLWDPCQFSVPAMLGFMPGVEC